MKKSIIFLVFIVSGLVGLAQESENLIQTIKGKVINEATNEPISYTNIGLEGTLYGTASDIEGNFELKIPEELTTKNIYFSAVGFQNKMYPVTNLFDKEFNVVKLVSQSYDIGKIDIAAQSKVLFRILRMAAENTPYNFIGGPFNLICSYENNKTIDDTIKVDRQADVVIFDKTGYSQPSKLDAFQSLNYSIDYKNESTADYQFSTGINNLDELLEFDWIRSGTSILNPALLADFRLNLVDEPEINGRKFWVISFKQIAPTLAGSGDFYASSFEGKITVNKDDYSVKKIEGTVQSDKNSLQGRSLAVSSSGVKIRQNVLYDFTVNYTNLKPDIFLLNKTFECDGKKVTEQSQLKINQVQTTNITAIQNRDYFSGK